MDCLGGFKIPRDPNPGSRTRHFIPLEIGGSTFCSDFAVACVNKRLDDAQCARDLEELLNKLPGVLNSISSFGDLRLHPIHEFAKKGYQACCKVLVTAKRECIRLRDEDGNTPIHLAVLNGHTSVLELLCREADIAWLELKNNRGVTPQELAQEEVIARNSEKHKTRALECANLLAKYTNDESASEDDSSESSESESEDEKKKKRKAPKKEKKDDKPAENPPVKDEDKNAAEKKDKVDDKKEADKGAPEKSTTDDSKSNSPKKSRKSKKKDEKLKQALEKLQVLYKRHKHQNDENIDKGRIIEKGLSEWKRSKEEFNERTNSTTKRDEVKKIRELVSKIKVTSNLTQIEELCIALVALLDRLR